MGRMKDLGSRSGLLHFSVVNEARKLREICKAQPPAFATLCNADDLIHLPFKPNSLGFFIALVPGQMHNTPGNFTYIANEGQRPAAQAFVGKHNVQQLAEGLLLVSTACTWDLVAGKLLDAQALGFGALAFTTPERLQILAENPAHLR